MLIYLIFFLISFLFITYGNFLQIKGKKRYWIYEMMGILTLSLLAGMRSYKIGTDVEFYAKPIFNNAIMFGFFNHPALATKEIGYIFFNYLVSLISNSFSFYLFVLQFFILFFSYKGIKYINPKHKVLIYIIFIFLYYNRSFNVIRQSMAMGLVLISLKYVFNKEPKKFIAIIFLAFLLHESALVFLIVYPLYKILNSSSKNTKYLIVLFFIVSILLLIFFDKILLFLVDFKILPTRFIKYTTLYYNEEINLDLCDFLMDIFLIIIYFLFNKSIKKKYPNSNFYFFLLLIDTICNIIGGWYTIATRIGLYFRIPALLFFLTSFDAFIKESKQKAIVTNLLPIAITIFYWAYLYGYRHVGRTIPYEFNNNLFR